MEKAFERKEKIKNSFFCHLFFPPRSGKNKSTMELDSFLLALDAVEGDPPGLHRDCKRCK